MDLAKIQNDLRKQNIDGWLLYDFRRMNDLACHFLKIPSEKLLTRRFFYWIPQEGSPVKIVHSIENPLEHLPGITLKYHTWNKLESLLEETLEGYRQIAMEYSPRNAIPYLSKVDAGTIEVIRGFGIKVVSSCDLLQKYTSVWDDAKLATHYAAASVLDKTAEKTWQYIFENLKNSSRLTEYDVQQFILKEFANHGCITCDYPICAVNDHSADPHYVPQEKTAVAIRPGDFILIDLWCKQDLPGSVYADITRVGVAAANPTRRQNEIFEIVKKAQHEAVEFVKKSFEQGRVLRGCDVDDCCRQVIKKAGFEDFFIHRTGHSIDEADHGPGANIDNFETMDQRQILPCTCFSIEPGIYLPGEFGIRLEYDLFIHSTGMVEITGGVQEKIVCM